MTDRLAVLDLLIRAQWADWPQTRIPPDVLVVAERGELPRVCREPRRYCVYAAEAQTLTQVPRRVRVAAHAAEMRRNAGGGA